jgi:DNA-binding protein HU-beta
MSVRKLEMDPGAEIVASVAKRAAIPQAKAPTSVDTALSAPLKPLGARHRLKLPGFGIFEVRWRKAGVGRHTRTGPIMAIRPGNTVPFTLGKTLPETL